MRVGIISGSGTYEWPGLLGATGERIVTPYGDVAVSGGHIGDADVIHLPRHEVGHVRASGQVQHRANMAALIESGVSAIIALTVCGAVDSAIAPGTLVIFDDMYFPTNRLPDGSLCTWHVVPGGADRGHWIFDRPFSEPLRQALVSTAQRLHLPHRAGGCYGHTDGPRLSSRTEIAALARAGVAAVSQTGGPEIVLAGEAGIPFALVGFITDYANGAVPDPEPLTALVARLRESTGIFAALVNDTIKELSQRPAPAPAGIVYRFEH